MVGNGRDGQGTSGERYSSEVLRQIPNLDKVIL